MSIRQDELTATQALASSFRYPSGATLSSPATIEDIELTSLIKSLFYRARSTRRPYVAQWNRNYRILRNRTWPDGRPGWLPSPEVPEIYPIIASIVGWMTDTRPTFDVVPSSQPFSPYHEFYNDLAQDLQTCLQTAWLIHEYEAEIEQVVWDGFIYGGGIVKTGWDNSLVGGMGDALLRRTDPYTFYPDPQATSMYDANYFIEARTMSLQEIDRRWPGSAERVASSAWAEDLDQPPNPNTTGSTPMANPGAIPPNTNSSYGLPGQSRSHVVDDLGVTIFELWLREWPETIPDPDDKSTIGVKDSWRVIVMAGNYVLMNEPATELWSHGQHPYDRFVPHRTGEFWGLSMVDMLRPSQLAINDLLANLQQNVQLTGNPVFKESARAGISRTRITNRAGQRLPVGEGGIAEWMPPPPVHPMMSELIQFYITEMERISGLSAISRGMQPSGRPSEGVLDSLQESSFVRVRLALRNLEWCLRSAGEKIASLIVENYTQPRWVAETGPQGLRSSLALKGNHFYLPSPAGRIPMRFQLLIQAGSSLATSRMARVQEADTLFAMGALDIEAILEAHNWPNRAIITERIEKLMAAGAFQPPGARQRAHH